MFSNGAYTTLMSIVSIGETNNVKQYLRSQVHQGA